MSATITYKTFEVMVPVTDVSVDTINKLRTNLVTCFQEKLKKLKIYLESLETSIVDGQIIVKDAYLQHKDFKEIVASFGMNILELISDKNGKTYLIQDESIQLLSYLMNVNELVHNYSSKIEKEIHLLAQKNFKDNNQELESLLKELQETGQLTVASKIEKKITSHGSRVDRVETVKDDSKEKTQAVSAKINEYIKSANEYLKLYNTDMVAGTKAIIHSRARAMGYQAQEVKKGNKTQIVLVKLG